MTVYVAVVCQLVTVSEKINYIFIKDIQPPKLKTSILMVRRVKSLLFNSHFEDIQNVQ
jgi:hypothetical protein